MFQLRRNLQQGLAVSHNTCQIPLDTSYGLLIRDNPSPGKTLQFPQIFFIVSTKKSTGLQFGPHSAYPLFALTLFQKGRDEKSYEFLNRYSMQKLLNDVWKRPWLQTKITKVWKTLNKTNGNRLSIFRADALETHASALSLFRYF